MRSLRLYLCRLSPWQRTCRIAKKTLDMRVHKNPRIFSLRNRRRPVGNFTISRKVLIVSNISQKVKKMQEYALKKKKNKKPRNMHLYE